MKLLKLIVLINFLSDINSLNKFGSQIIDSYSSVTFVSGEFKDNKEMHFSIKTLKNNFLDEYNYVTYYYIGQNGEDNSSQGGLYVIYERTENDEDYETKFFTITKKSTDYRPYDGNNRNFYFFNHKLIYLNIKTFISNENKSRNKVYDFNVLFEKKLGHSNKYRDRRRRKKKWKTGYNHNYNGNCSCYCRDYYLL